ncbi:hypothetical protein Skr01_27580 [Sphaerisporangium krabiense]|nr:hypothetical protein Skr01_27580 [Sphaerisporangium krabiense]
MPVMRTRVPRAAASRTASATSRAEEGTRTSAGSTAWLPAQFRKTAFMLEHDNHERADRPDT